MPPSVDEWLPERHLARFMMEMVVGFNLRAMTSSYRGSGHASYRPQILLGIIIYGYATGVFFRRKLEQATYDSLAFRVIAANEHPDHDTIPAFHRGFFKQIQGLFVQVLMLACEMGVLKLAMVALDGIKIHTNASRHSALLYEHAGKIEVQLQAEVVELRAKAEAADQTEVPDDMSIPEELARDSSYFTEGNVNACAGAGINPVIAMGRKAYHPTLAERFSQAPPPPNNPNPLEAIDHRLKTPEGKILYALRKQIP